MKGFDEEPTSEQFRQEIKLRRRGIQVENPNPMPFSMPLLRPATPADIPKIQYIFRESILQTCTPDYSAAQCHVWANAGNDAAKWGTKIRQQNFWLALHQNRVVGFMSWEASYLDLLYVHPAFQRRGIARQLLRHMMQWAASHAIPSLFTDASLTARPFFERHGFQVMATQQPILGGIALPNFRMKKVH